MAAHKTSKNQQKHSPGQRPPLRNGGNEGCVKTNIPSYIFLTTNYTNYTNSSVADCQLITQLSQVRSTSRTKGRRPEGKVKSQKDFFYCCPVKKRPKGPERSQPRAAPWVASCQRIRPVRATETHERNLLPLQGAAQQRFQNPGRCPGLSYHWPFRPSTFGSGRFQPLIILNLLKMQYIQGISNIKENFTGQQ